MTDETKRAEEQVEKAGNREETPTPEGRKGSEIREEKS